ncbi:BREX system P-loop protein BrxC [Syntrophomonas wolfei]|jgi:hypothetical protein|uniref:BREX system P-loop protein BrxC n=1 Tax=Syntrophomonas wolfei TaxID=863 RepID=UPI000772FDC2|nr:BREX system P-loop protein BrxC [Syntrophomonas wolfei]
MLLREMFVKNIDREIKGVIKVAQDDETNRFQELDEYVVTRELLKHFSSFYQNYQKGIDGFTDEMGVWISGFFGSGKSHFLKILSYLLDNEEVKGQKPADFFADKIADPAVYADIQRAAQINCETILFNIDSKSPLGVKSDKEAILKVFAKVFYEHLGYYGDDFKVVELEKFLSKEGVLDKYQANFAAIKGEPWLERRNCFLFDEDAIVEALIKTTAMSEQSARNWFNHNRSQDISIEQFAREVKEYINRQGKNFHLIFLVDEIGQYIGDNPQLMLNLQTVVEDLGTHCHGKVWVIVTSQEDIDAVTKVKGNDFSKIQGRFRTRLSLSSASVDEVIKKRILEKNDFAQDKLKLLYQENSAALKNLIHFTTGTVADLKGYSGEDEFSETYPFVPYQFKLLQEVFNQIRRHGASGKHLSEGERSMLSAFQDAAKKLAGEEDGVLVPFQAFYDSVHEFLDGSIQRVIARATEGAAKGEGLEAFDVEVLKLLFLIRYVGDIPPHVDNIAMLMVSSIDEDKLSLKSVIQKSLTRLIAQNYVQKNADEYRFLTDDEQDINREIRNTFVDSTLVVSEIGRYIFNDIYEDQKYKYSQRYPFSFNSKIDESTIGHQSARIGLRVLTSESDVFDADDAALKMASAAANDLIIRLNDNSDYFDEMHQALKIERFDKIKKQEGISPNLKKIMLEKQEEAAERKKRAKSMLEEALLNGRYYVNGERIEARGASPKERINHALKMLVDSVYYKLPYIKKYLDSDADIEAILQGDKEQLTLAGEGSAPNHLAAEEVMSYIDLQDMKHLQTSMKNILDKFEDQPFGWREIDIAGLVANLFKQQKIRLLYQGNYLESDDKSVVTYLRKKTEVDKLLLKKRVNVDPDLIKVARDLCKELFNLIDLPSDEDGLIKRLLEEIKARKLQVHEEYLSQYAGKKYPGKEVIDQGLIIFKEIEGCKQDHISLLNKLKEHEDDLLDWDEDMKRVEGFFKNQRQIFDKGLAILERINNNQSYLQEAGFMSKARELAEIVDAPSPYSKIIQIPELAAWLEEQYQELLDSKKAGSRSKIEKDCTILLKILEHYGLSHEDRRSYWENVQNWYQAKYLYIDESLNFERLDAVIIQSVDFCEKIQKEIEQAAKKQHPPSTGTGTGVEEPELYVIEYRDLAFAGSLQTENDVEQYLEHLRRRLKQLIRESKIIKFMP